MVRSLFRSTEEGLAPANFDPEKKDWEGFNPKVERLGSASYCGTLPRLIGGSPLGTGRVEPEGLAVEFLAEALGGRLTIWKRWGWLSAGLDAERITKIPCINAEPSIAKTVGFCNAFSKDSDAEDCMANLYIP
jgi:hypothetical protein